MGEGYSPSLLNQLNGILPAVNQGVGWSGFRRKTFLPILHFPFLARAIASGQFQDYTPCAVAPFRRCPALYPLSSRQGI
jgi:hypothetical protein